MVKKQNIFAETLLSPLHWVGWALTIIAVLVTAHLLGIHAVHTPWWNAVIIGIVIIIVDSVKHLINLQ